jgi:hypothetical protein
MFIPPSLDPQKFWDFPSSPKIDTMSDVHCMSWIPKYVLTLSRVAYSCFFMVQISPLLMELTESCWREEKYGLSFLPGYFSDSQLRPKYLFYIDDRLIDSGDYLTHPKDKDIIIKKAAKMSSIKNINFPLSVHTCIVERTSADIYHHNIEKWYRNAVIITKHPLEHYYLSHATFPFPCDRFLRQAVGYNRFLAFWVNFVWLVATALLYPRWLYHFSNLW